MSSLSMHEGGSSTMQSENPVLESLLKQRGRGPTRGKRSEHAVLTTKHKLQVEFNKNGEAIGENACAWAREIGFIVRSMAPLAVKKWKEFGDASKTPLLDRLHEKFEFELDQPIKDAIDRSMHKRWHDYRCRLHKKFEGMGGNGDIRLAKRNKPASIVEQSDWDFLCDYFASDEMKKKSKVSKANRAKRKMVTLQGSKSYAAHAHEMRDPSTKELPGHIKFFYEMNYSNERGWTTKEAESHYNQMVELLQKQNSQLDLNEQYMPLKEFEICEQVLGKRFSYVDHQKNSKKTRLGNCDTCVEKTALQNEVEDLRSQLKSVQTFLSRIPEEFLRPIQSDVSSSNGLNGDN